MANNADLPYVLEACTDINDERFDGVVLITDRVDKVKGPLEVLGHVLWEKRQVDANLEKEVSVLIAKGLKSQRLIFSPTGPLNRDFDDVRRFSEAAEKGIKRAFKAGCKSPLLVRAPDQSFPNADLVTLLGALQAYYVPLEVREASNKISTHATKLGVWGLDAAQLNRNFTRASTIESGRIVCRDIGGSDPERMAPPRVVEYLKHIFNNSNSSIKMEVIESEEQITKEFPLLAAVNRAARGIERHRARVIHLTYVGAGTIETTLMMVGKGVTYDTGGADLKVGGVMAGMHRDKCGAAAVAGFFQVLNKLKPEGIKVVGSLAMVRNSVGSDSYVADEIVTSRNGMRVRIANTDAEGRMAMGDLLCQMREKSVSEINPHLFTVATLTGHACIAVGEGYTIVIDNGPACNEMSAKNLQAAGESFADCIEISTLRREDYEMNAPKSEYEDIMQCNSLPSTRTPRGHQFPAAFLVQIAGLDKHGSNSDKPIKYSHVDIAPSSGPYPGVPTGAPIVALASRYLFSRPTAGGNLV